MLAAVLVYISSFECISTAPAVSESWFLAALLNMRWSTFSVSRFIPSSSSCTAKMYFFPLRSSALEKSVIMTLSNSSVNSRIIFSRNCEGFPRVHRYTVSSISSSHILQACVCFLYLFKKLVAQDISFYLKSVLRVSVLDSKKRIVYEHAAVMILAADPRKYCYGS